MPLEWQVVVVAIVAVSLRIMACIDGARCRTDWERVGKKRCTRESLSPTTNPLKLDVRWHQQFISPAFSVQSCE